MFTEISFFKKNAQKQQLISINNDSCINKKSVKTDENFTPVSTLSLLYFRKITLCINSSF